MQVFLHNALNLQKLRPGGIIKQLITLDKEECLQNKELSEDNLCGFRRMFFRLQGKNAGDADIGEVFFDAAIGKRFKVKVYKLLRYSTKGINSESI